MKKDHIDSDCAQGGGIYSLYRFPTWQSEAMVPKDPSLCPARMSHNGTAKFTKCSLPGLSVDSLGVLPASVTSVLLDSTTVADALLGTGDVVATCSFFFTSSSTPPAPALVPRFLLRSPRALNIWYSRPGQRWQGRHSLSLVCMSVPRRYLLSEVHIARIPFCLYLCGLG
jgi:hypothetical protein